MNTPSDNQILDRGFDYDYELTIWIQPVNQKSFCDFKESLSSIIHPLELCSNEFELGGIACRISEVQKQPPTFDNVPYAKYVFCITIDIPGEIIWGLIARQFAIALTVGIRTKFESRYLVTNEEDCFILFSGTNLPQYINSNYESWNNGELNGFRHIDAVAIGV